MFTVIILFTSIIGLVSTYYSFQQESACWNSTLLGVTLTQDQAAQPEVQSIVTTYKKKIKKITLISLLLHLPLLLIIDWYTSVFLTLYFLWWVFMVGGCMYLRKSKTKALLALKAKHKWISAQAESAMRKNMTRSGAKFFAYVGWLLLAVLLTGMVVMFLMMDFVPYQLLIEKEDVKIKAPVYSDSFPIQEIEHVTLLDEFPDVNRSKSNGAATNQYLLGNFSLQTFGKCKIYCYRGYQPVIQINLPDYTVFFNSKDKDNTIRLYRDLQDALSQNSSRQ